MNLVSDYAIYYIEESELHQAVDLHTYASNFMCPKDNKKQNLFLLLTCTFVYQHIFHIFRCT